MLKLIASFGLSTQTFKTGELRHPASTSVPLVGEFQGVDSSQDQGRVDHTVHHKISCFIWLWVVCRRVSFLMLIYYSHCGQDYY